MTDRAFDGNGGHWGQQPGMTRENGHFAIGGTQQEPGGSGNGSSSRNAQQAAEHEWGRQGGELGNGDWISPQVSRTRSSFSPIRSESNAHNGSGHHEQATRQNTLDLFPISGNQDAFRAELQQIAPTDALTARVATSDQERAYSTGLAASQNFQLRSAPPPGFERRDFGQHMPVFSFRTAEPSDIRTSRNLVDDIHAIYDGRSNEVRLRQALKVYQTATRTIGQDLLKRCDLGKFVLEDVILIENMSSKIGTAHLARQKLEKFIVETSIATDSAHE